MFCPNCGTQLADDALFCSSCGSQVRLAGDAITEVPVQAADASIQTDDTSASEQTVVSGANPTLDDVVPAVPEAPQQDSAEPAPKKKGKVIPILVAILLLALAGFGVYLAFFKTVPIKAQVASNSWVTEESSRVPVEVTKVGVPKSEYVLNTYLDDKGMGISLPRGEYQITLSGLFMTRDGGLMEPDSSRDSVEVIVGFQDLLSSLTDPSYVLGPTGGNGLKLIAIDDAAVSDEQIKSAVALVTADPERKDAAFDLERKSTARRNRAVEEEKNTYHGDGYTFVIPNSWRDQIELIDGSLFLKSSGRELLEFDTGPTWHVAGPDMMSDGWYSWWGDGGFNDADRRVSYADTEGAWSQAFYEWDGMGTASFTFINPSFISSSTAEEYQAMVDSLGIEYGEDDFPMHFGFARAVCMEITFD